MIGITLIMSLLSLSFISAIDYLPQKINTPFDLVVSSNNATNCNVTSIQYPSGSTSLVNYEMNKTGHDFNYTINETNFANLGNICFGITCTDGLTIETGSVCRTITPNGNTQSTSQGIGSFAFIILMLGLTVLFGYIGFRLSESQYLWVVGIFFLFLCVIFTIYDVYMGYEYHRLLTGINDGSGLPEIMFYAFMFLLVAGLLVSLGLLFTNWKKLVKYIKREIKDRDYNLEQDAIDREFE